MGLSDLRMNPFRCVATGSLLTVLLLSSKSQRSRKAILEFFSTKAWKLVQQVALEVAAAGIALLLAASSGAFFYPYCLPYLNR